MLANRGIAFKLGLGFALLILFTVAVAVVGYLGLGGMLARSAKMDAVGAISENITSARMNMLYYMVSSDSTRVEALRKNLVKAREETQALKPPWPTPATGNAWTPSSPRWPATSRGWDAAWKPKRAAPRP
jgi:hypothetical protein